MNVVNNVIENGFKGYVISVNTDQTLTDIRASIEYYLTSMLNVYYTPKKLISTHIKLK